MEDSDERAARRRRDKPQLSCNLCRKRKLRCDRCQPCHNCSRRGLAESCVFPESNLSRPDTTDQPGQPAPANVKDRVKQLESHVEFLMGALKQANSAATRQDHASRDARPSPENGRHPEQTLEEPIVGPESAGYLELSPNQTSYVGSANWVSIMKNIPELADVFASTAQLNGENGGILATGDSDLRDLTTWSGSFTRQDILEALPSKEFADSLVAVCFTNSNNEAMIVHPPTFRKEYEEFWADPTSVSTIWVGLLFALMCLAVQYQRFSLDEARRLQILESDPEKIIRLYHEKIIQCLILGKYSRGPPYAVETMMLYLFIEALRGQDIKSLDSPWIQWGNLVRVALKAGYHRDGAHFPHLSCFQAETRRRVWSLLVGWDLYLSTQFALPRMIHIAACDTMPPRNLYDEDLYEHMVELPPPRPDSAQSFSQFHVSKNQLLEIFTKITDLTMSVTSAPKYSEVLKLDRLLSTTYEAIIPVWQPRAPRTDAADPSESPGPSIMCTFLAFIYHKAQMVLHRRFMSIGRRHRQYAYSRQVTIEAALTTLQHQWVLYLETQVGGQLCRHGWKFLVLLVQDFLFATAVLCAELAEEICLASSLPTGDIPVASHKDKDVNHEIRNRVFQGLSSAYIVWLQSNDAEASREVKLVVASLKHLLRKASEAGFGQAKMLAPPPPAPSNISPNANSVNTSPENSQQGVGSGADTPHTGEMYWGLGHFPI